MTDDTFFGRLRRLLARLEELDDIQGSGRADRGPAGIDYDYDVSVGLDARSRSDRRGSRRSRRTRHPRYERTGDGPVDRSGDSTESDGSGGVDRTLGEADYHVDVDRREDELLVRADLPGVGTDDVTVAVEDDRLVVAVAGEAVESIPAPEAATVREVSVNNGVLVARIAADQSETGGDPEPDGGSRDGTDDADGDGGDRP